MFSDPGWLFYSPTPLLGPEHSVLEVSKQTWQNSANF